MEQLLEEDAIAQKIIFGILKIRSALNAQLKDALNHAKEDMEEVNITKENKEREEKERKVLKIEKIINVLTHNFIAMQTNLVKLVLQLKTLMVLA
jgi:hypothetical protein